VPRSTSRLDPILTTIRRAFAHSGRSRDCALSGTAMGDASGEVDVESGQSIAGARPPGKLADPGEASRFGDGLLRGSAPPPVGRQRRRALSKCRPAYAERKKARSRGYATERCQREPSRRGSGQGRGSPRLGLWRPPRPCSPQSDPAPAARTWRRAAIAVRSRDSAISISGAIPDVGVSR